jgi:hypothetical protein
MKRGAEQLGSEEAKEDRSVRQKLTVRGRAQKSGYESLEAPGGYLALREATDFALRWLLHGTQDRLEQLTEFNAKHFVTAADRAALAEFLAMLPNLRVLELDFSIPYTVRVDNDTGIKEDCLQKLEEVVIKTNEVIRVHEISIMTPLFRFLSKLPALKSLVWFCNHQGNMENYLELFELLSSSESLERIMLEGAQLDAAFDSGLGFGLPLPATLKELVLPDLARKTRSWWSEPGDEESKREGQLALEKHRDDKDAPFFFDEDPDPCFNYAYAGDIEKFEAHLRTQAKESTAAATVNVCVG